MIKFWGFTSFGLSIIRFEYLQKAETLRYAID